MKYSEFKRKVEALSSKYQVRIEQTAFFTQVAYKGKGTIDISRTEQFDMRTGGSSLESLPFSHKLYMLAAELAMTPIDERKSEKKYVFPIWTNFLGDTWYLMTDMNKTTRHKNKAMKFTQSEIDEYNKDFTFDLNTIKQEVKDD
ncbi:hypothetical protein [Lactiplantibacillus paraxiangfangensis]|uniref:hypothetical protein n=1 Tax=Lactiplantibacillus paraxiangfangensis TaxID=3076224 RepID=UPI0030C6D685